MKTAFSTFCRAFIAACLLQLANQATALSASPPPVQEGQVRTSPDSHSSGSHRSAASRSALERFRTYSGPRTREALTGLFLQPEYPGFHQQPAIAISDGKTAVLVTIQLSAGRTGAPTFSSANATMLSMEQKKQGWWLVKMLPHENSMDVSFTTTDDKGTQIFPLTVAPPLPKSIAASEQGFADYLQESHCGTPMRDLNNDGMCDYLDDFLFVANYLAAKSAKGPDLKSRQQRALKRTLTQHPSAAKPEFDPDQFE